MSLSFKERNDLLKRIEEVNSLPCVDKNGKKLPREELRKIGIMEEKLREEYLQNLPVIKLARCPFCFKVIDQKMDIYGLDSKIYWHSSTVSNFYFSIGNECPHELLRALSINFNGIKYPEEIPVDRRKSANAETGPEVPYIVPYYLDQGLEVVMNSFNITFGKYTVYTMLYFADKKTELLNNQLWEFDIEKMMKAYPSQIYWHLKDDPEMKLYSPKDGAQNPYINLPGRRKPLWILDNKVIEKRLPDGEPTVIDYEGRYDNLLTHGISFEEAREYNKKLKEEEERKRRNQWLYGKDEI